MFIKYPAFTKIEGVVLLKDDIEKETLFGNTVEMVVTFQRKATKANLTMQAVLVVAIVILGGPAR